VSGQTWTAETYARNAAFVPALGAPVVAWLAPQPGERILDLGCGDGTLTESIVAAGAHVIGIDGSADFVATARAKGSMLASATHTIFRSTPSSTPCFQTQRCIGCSNPIA